MTVALCAAFFASGAAALLFQTLWFRLAGLTFGNSVWASSLVLASFMGGLALGNGLMAVRGGHLRRPLRVYAALEVGVGLAGLGLVVVFPALPQWLVPVFRGLGDQPWLLNPLRVVLSGLLMLVPTAAMGATLPILMKALSRPEGGFGPALGRLYGWNTLGAVAGALGGELLLTPALGLRGSGMTAAALNLSAAAVALTLRDPRFDVSTQAPGAPSAGLAASGPRIWGVLGTAACAGGILLALEVVWFRFLLLWVSGTSLAFALMLAAVLAGIATGGLAAAVWLTRSPRADVWLPAIAFLAGIATLASYAGFDAPPRLQESDDLVGVLRTLALSATLMLPTSFLSGVLFTLMGRSLKEEMGGETLTTGALTLANTTGAMIGTLLAGFVLLPHLGVERSMVLLALGYGVVAAGLVRSRRSPSEVPPVPRWSWALAGVGLCVCLAVFPFGRMDRTFMARVAARFGPDGSRPVAVREGLTETILYMRKDLLGEPLTYRLVTNGFSMSATGFLAERYMKLYVYWPLAVRPEARHALLISYGVGMTAKALTDWRGLESIDVVDISRDILEIGRRVFPPPEAHPLDDPRVRVHIEDGRQFLLTTARSFDLITAEPPPPGQAGVVSLYSKEYFALARGRLAPGGVLTYWLPVSQLDLSSTRAVLRGFCDVFEDCSVWTGAGLNWMLAGSQGARSPTSEAAFSRQWHDEVVGPTLRSLALETPRHLAATFLGDAAFLKELIQGSPPLTDDHPHRLSPRRPPPATIALYARLMDTTACRERFERSPFIASIWPVGLRGKTGAVFEEQRLLNDRLLPDFGGPRLGQFPSLYEALSTTRSVALPLVITGSQAREQAIANRAVARGESGPGLDYLLGVGALAKREYAVAERLFAKVQEQEPGFSRISDFRALAACLGGDGRRMRSLLGSERTRAHPESLEREFWAGLEERCQPAPAAGGSGEASAHTAR